MTEEKEQTTPDVETERVEQEQIETAQPTAESIEETQETIETPETSTTPVDAVQEVPSASQESPDVKGDESEEFQPQHDTQEIPAADQSTTDANGEASEQGSPEASEAPIKKGDASEQPQLLLEAQVQPEVSLPTANEKADVLEQTQESLKQEKAERIRLNKKRRRNMAQYTLTISHFAACGRCSYFLAGYRVIHGVENLETAVFDSKAGWLSLSWNHDMRKLLTKSYGIELYADIYHFDGCCPECGRHYTFQAGDTPEGVATLRVQMNNRWY